MPFHVGVVAAALRDVGGDGEPDPKQLAHLQKKVAGVLATMAAYQYDHVVLGSWGCGAFGNPTSLVARAFAEALGGPFSNVFASVTFPVTDKAGRAAFGHAFASLRSETISLAATGSRMDVHRGSSGAHEPPPPRRGLSAIYGTGASAHTEEELIEWQEVGMRAQDAARRKDWSAARMHFERCVELRPEWPKGQACLDRVIAKAMEAQQQLADGAMAFTGAESGGAAAAAEPPAPEAPTRAPAALDGAATEFAHRVKGVKLLPHERELFERGLLKNVTHEGATAIWLRAESTPLNGVEDAAATSTDAADSSGATVPTTAVYRPMGDCELRHLLKHGVLPSTQPYQTIVRGAAGRAYAEKYLRGAKWVDSSPTTVVEFVCPTCLIDELFAMQCKPEEGMLSHGLGDKGGKGLSKFNASLASGASHHRIVLVKRGRPPSMKQN